MNGRYLLDTNIIIALFGNDPAVLMRLSAADAVFIPSIVLGELYYGAYKSINIEVNTVRINEFADRASILTCDSTTARHYGKIKSLLRAKGRPLPENDIWIAALAEQHQLAVITRDEHFKEVESVLTERW